MAAVERVRFIVDVDNSNPLTYDVTDSYNCCAVYVNMTTSADAGDDARDDGGGDAMMTTLLVVEITLMLTSLAANGLVLVAFINNKHLRENVTNFYLLQLSLVNFLLGLVSVLHIVAIVWPHAMAHPLACLTRYSAMLVVCGFSTLSLLAISYDRFLAIAGPLYYRTQISRGRVLAHCLLIYSLPLLLFLLVPLLWRRELAGGEQCSMVHILARGYLALLVLPFYLVISSVLVLLFVITVALQRRRMRGVKKLVASMPFNWKRNSAYRRSSRLTKTSGFVLASFLICWLPFFINLIIQVYADGENDVTDVVAAVAFLPILFNSALTPILYVYRLSTFRSAIKKLFCHDRYLQEKREYEINRLLLRRNAIRTIRDSYDSTTTMLTSTLYTSQQSYESTSDFDTEIFDDMTTSIETLDLLDGVSRRGSLAAVDHVMPTSNTTNAAAILEQASSPCKECACQSGGVSADVTNSNRSDVTSRRLAASLRAYSRRNSLSKEMTISASRQAVDVDTARRQSSPEVTDVIAARPSLCTCKELRKATAARRNSRDLHGGSTRNRRYSVLQDIPEGSALIAQRDPEGSALIAQRDCDPSKHANQKLSSSQDKSAATGATAARNRFRIYGRRKSTPAVLTSSVAKSSKGCAAVVLQAKRRRRQSLPPLQALTGTQVHAHADVITADKAMHADAIASDAMHNNVTAMKIQAESDGNGTDTTSPSAASKRPATPCIIIVDEETANNDSDADSDVTFSGATSAQVHSDRGAAFSESTSVQVPNSSDAALSEPTSAQVHNDCDAAPAAAATEKRHLLATQHLTIEPLPADENGLLAPSTRAQRRKSSRLLELTAPIARRLSAMFKTPPDTTLSDGTEMQTLTKKQKLKGRLFSAQQNSATLAADDISAAVAAAGASGSKQSDGASGRCLDQVLMEVVQDDPSIVVELLEDLQELLHEDETLSAIVINDIQRRAEQAIVQTQLNRKQRRISAIRNFLLRRTPPYDLTTLPMTSSAAADGTGHDVSRRSTISSSCDVARDVNALKPSDGVYAIAYEGKRKQKSLAHIFRSTFQQADIAPTSFQQADIAPTSFEAGEKESLVHDAARLNGCIADHRKKSINKLNYEIPLITIDDFGAANSGNVTDVAAAARIEKPPVATQNASVQHNRCAESPQCDITSTRDNNDIVAESNRSSTLTNGAKLLWTDTPTSTSRKRRRRSFAAIVKERIVGSSNA